jgi:RNA polymerase sigma-70 factor (ECF subfamily)
MVDAVFFMRAAEPMLTQLYRVAYCILRSRADAEDAVQQGMLKAWAVREKIRPDSFRPWVTRIVVNESRNIQRYRMRVTPSETVGTEDSFEPPEPDIMEAVYALPEKLRIPFSLRYVANYQEREVADALRLPLNTVKSRLARARQSLRNTLAEEG